MSGVPGAGWPFAPRPAGGASLQDTTRGRCVGRASSPGAAVMSQFPAHCAPARRHCASTPAARHSGRGEQEEPAPRTRHAEPAQPESPARATAATESARSPRAHRLEHAQGQDCGRRAQRRSTHACGHAGRDTTETHVAPTEAPARRDPAPPPDLHAQSAG